MKAVFGAVWGVLLAGCDGAAPTAAVEDTGPLLELFVMSQCPYGVEVENGAIPAKKKLGSAVRLAIHYIGEGDADNLQSLHGEPEIKGDIAQLCVREKEPAKFLDFVACQNENMRSVDTNWSGCAERLGIDKAALTSCLEGPEGRALAAASFKLSVERGAMGSPTMFIDGKPYNGGRKEKHFLKAWCEAITGEKPAACAEIPAPQRVDAIFFSDVRCTECDIAPVEGKLKSELGGLVVKSVDYGTEEGKALFAAMRAADPAFMLPSILLSPDVEKDKDAMEMLGRFLRPLGDYRELRLGGTHDPSGEICKNPGDEDGNGQADCADPKCAQTIACRTPSPGTLDMFVMSQCPYGAMAMMAVAEVAPLFGDEMKVNVHFIGDVEGDKLTSMHGPNEVEEDIREICATKKYAKGNQFLKYLACRSKDYQNMDWKPCAKEAGMDAGVLEACAKGEGPGLLRDSFKLAASLGIGASPTFLGNGVREFNAVAAADVQTQFCQDNPTLAGCKNALVLPKEGAAPPVPAGQCN